MTCEQKDNSAFKDEKDELQVWHQIQYVVDTEKTLAGVTIVAQDIERAKSMIGPIKVDEEQEFNVRLVPYKDHAGSPRISISILGLAE